MRKVIVTIFIATLAIAVSACQRETPPGPNTMYATVTCHGSWLLLDWPQGLRILLWDDIYEGNHSNHGESSTSDPVYRLSGDGQSEDGHRYEYRAATRDGIQADFAIDGVSYDLAGGTVFLIGTAGGRTQVQQLDRDLSGLVRDYDAVETFSRQDPEIAAFMGSGECPER